MSTATLQKHLDHVLGLLPPELRHPAVLASLQLAIAEDLHAEADFSALWPHLAGGDISSQATLAPDSVLHGRIFAKAEGVAAGLPVAQAVFALLEPRLEFVQHAAEGSLVHPGDLLAELHGPGRALLAGERSALNYLGRLSGIASLTRRFVDAMAGTRAVLLDTRKTAPGLRHFDKYAVKMGGAQNHRAGLYDMIMVKDNHIDGAGGITAAVARVRSLYGSRYAIEVEVKNLAELAEALPLNVERIMLDNMSLEMMCAAVIQAAGRTPLEASGNVSLERVRAIAETGVDYISCGALTHSAPVLDISLRLSAA